jgi:outer membrane immunogenic protein
MKKMAFAIAALGMAAASAPAFAADMALKAPPPAPVYNWTGWYAGLNLGGSFGKASDTVTYAGVPIATTGSQQLDGIIGGGQLGYNWQSGTWLAGLEADIQGSSERANNPALAALGPVTIPGIAAFPVTGTLGVNERLSWFGTLRGRLGVLATPTWLFYVTGGLAYGEIQTSETFTIGALAFGNNFSTTHAGWTAGGGIEGSINSNWSAKVEYLYIDLGTVSSTFAPAGIPVPFSPIGFSSHVTDNILRVGVNYHFH